MMNPLTEQLARTLTAVLRRYFREVDYLVERDRTIDALSKALTFAETPQDYRLGAITVRPSEPRNYWKDCIRVGLGIMEDWETSTASGNVRDCLHAITFCDTTALPPSSTILCWVPSAPPWIPRCQCPDAQFAPHRTALRIFETAWPKRLLHPEIIADRGWEFSAEGVQAVLSQWDAYPAKCPARGFSSRERLARSTAEGLRSRDAEYTACFRMQPPNGRWCSDSRGAPSIEG